MSNNQSEQLLLTHARNLAVEGIKTMGRLEGVYIVAMDVDQSTANENFDFTGKALTSGGKNLRVLFRVSKHDGTLIKIYGRIECEEPGFSFHEYMFFNGSAFDFGNHICLDHVLDMLIQSAVQKVHQKSTNWTILISEARFQITRNGSLGPKSITVVFPTLFAQDVHVTFEYGTQVDGFLFRSLELHEIDL